MLKVTPEVATVQMHLTTADLMWAAWLRARADLILALDEVPELDVIASSWKRHEPASGGSKYGGRTVSQWLETVHLAVGEHDVRAE